VRIFWPRLPHRRSAVCRVSRVYRVKGKAHQGPNGAGLKSSRFNNYKDSTDSTVCGDSINSMTQQTQQTQPVFNIGTGVETSVNALAAMLLEAADADCPIVSPPFRAGEQRRSVIDPSRAAHVLRWTPTRPLPEGLKETIAWFQTQIEATAGASCVREQNGSTVR